MSEEDVKHPRILDVRGLFENPVKHHGINIKPPDSDVK
jgi:hypothetical protein